MKKLTKKDFNKKKKLLNLLALETRDLLQVSEV